MSGYPVNEDMTKYFREDTNDTTVTLTPKKEEEEGKVSVRSRFAGDEGQCGLEEFIEQIKEEVAAKKLRETVQDK